MELAKSSFAASCVKGYFYFDLKHKKSVNVLSINIQTTIAFDFGVVLNTELIVCILICKVQHVK